MVQSITAALNITTNCTKFCQNSSTLASLRAYKYRCLWFCPFRWLCRCCARCQYRLRVAAGRLDSAAICPQSAAVMLNSVTLCYFPLLLHSVSNKPKLPGIKSNSAVCKQSFGYYCRATKRCSGRWKRSRGKIKKFELSFFFFCHSFSVA